MKPVSIRIDLVGYSARSWPKIKIAVNNQSIFDGQVQERTSIRTMLEPDAANSIIIRHYDKNNDTVVDNKGNIINDRYCLLEAVWINQLCFDADYFSHNKIFYHCDDGEKIISNYFGKDGYFQLNFDYPLWQLWPSTQ